MQISEINELIKNMNVHLCEKDKEALCKYASLVPDKGTIVDIGTLVGGSAIIMALASKPNVKVITMDPIYNLSMSLNFKETNTDKKITYLQEKSMDAFNEFDKKEIDMLFIDGWHSAKAVLEDFNTWGSLVKKGGIIAFHDYFLYDNTIGTEVDRLVNGHKIKPIEIVDDVYTDGKRIGMLIGEKI